MTERNRAEDRDTVLFAFHVACERPTPQDIQDWTSRYPQYADDILDYAEIQLAQSERAREPELEPDETMIQRGLSRALNAVYRAEEEARRKDATASQDNNQSDFVQLLAAKGTNIAALSRQIHIDRMVMGELAAGRMKIPIGDRLMQAIVKALDISPQHADAAIRQSLAMPRLGPAKADQVPTINTRSYEDIILSSNLMSDEQKRYWLGKDSPWTPGETSD